MDNEISNSTIASEYDDTPTEVEDPQINELDNFREQWRQEFEANYMKSTSPTPEADNALSARNASPKSGLEEQATKLFIQGIEAERKGDLYEAIQFYRRAVQLVPDIEFRINPDSAQANQRDSEKSSDVTGPLENSDVDPADLKDLLYRFQQMLLRKTKICDVEYVQRMTHISALPVELLLYIFKWVVSSDLDMRALEQLSVVCRGFYVCAREPELWRLACMRVWGVNCGPCNKYGSWRGMFIERPRLGFNGAYISKTTYIRPGESAFQDQFYRPWHLVEYYRYLRFFPEGMVLMMTTPDDPYTTLPKLRYRNSRGPALLYGRYFLNSETINIALKQRKSTEQTGPYVRYKRNRNNNNQQEGEQTFHLELQIKSVQNRLNFQLVWKYYAVSTRCRNGQENASQFDLNPAKFPPFYFSRVKSYTSTSESPLQ